MLIDSLDMTENERAKISQHCITTKSKHIVVTHGTETMSETAKILASHTLKKTIVLTGAMIPYKFGSSDGLFNLGCALAFVQALPHGVYITMNGRYFKWDEVQKNKKLGEFEKIAKNI